MWVLTFSQPERKKQCFFCIFYEPIFLQISRRKGAKRYQIRSQKVLLNAMLSKFQIMHHQTMGWKPFWMSIFIVMYACQQAWLPCINIVYTKLGYHISSYSFRGNYSFLNLEIVANSNSCRNISICEFHLCSKSAQKW